MAETPPGMAREDEAELPAQGRILADMAAQTDARVPVLFEPGEYDHWLHRSSAS